MFSNDLIQRFTFDDTDIRGVIIHLNASYQAVLERHPYPIIVQELLGKALCASGLLSSTLKYTGSLTMQLQSQEPLTLLLTQCNSDFHLRGLAKFTPDIQGYDESQLLNQTGHLAITIEPQHGQRYQGIVSLSKPTLAECIENYFYQSEQLPTRLWLAANHERAAGLLLQSLPTKNIEKRTSDWEHLEHLAATITPEELINLDNVTLLHRLYHSELLRLYEEQPVCFRCRCSRERIETTLLQLGLSEIQSILDEQGVVKVNCEFCNQEYRFDAVDVHKLFQSPDSGPGSTQKH